MSRWRESRPLRVGLNLLFLGERAGGAGRYATALPAALLAAEPQTEVHVFVTRDAPAALRRESWAQSVRWVTLPIGLGGSPVELAAQFAGLPLLALARRLDVLHSPANTGPVLTPGLASVVSLLDLIWLHRGPEWEPEPRARERMLTLVRHCVRHADRVFAISQAAAEDFVRTLGVPRERIEVTPLGIDAAADARGGVEADLRARLELGAARVVLCVAQKRPYKNLHRLVRALAELDEDVVLVLPGAPTAYEAELRALATELGVAARVRFPDWLSDAELAEVYRLSDVFALPSLIEGFGLPVLEAMAHGVPVACSNVSALPEVAGDAALLFDPERQDEVTGAIRRLLEDRELAARLVARGRERVARFTWERTGAASLAGYRRAIAAQTAWRRHGSARAGQ
ncbi:MAG TPA: glycosyltransferase family 1 protein [Solirubrobacteraceae bacterium]|jgi:glycosyltransferase involved in cell wall biosynthesis|nr:glycosyltransferase family 1 protein [Solirubrobacteraceae bacterium]